MKISEAQHVITASALAGDTVIMEGLHGIGKSQVVQGFANENGHALVELFLSHQEVGDVIGIPTKVTTAEGEELTNWTKPVWLQRMVDAAWPKNFEYGTISFTDKDFGAFAERHLGNPSKDTIISRDNLNAAYMSYFRKLEDALYLVQKQTAVICSESRHSVLFLDELNRAPIDVRQSALQLVLEKKIHEHELPYVQGRPSMIVAAINPSDLYQVDELDAALLDRFLHINVEADASGWLKWARTANVNELVTSFIEEHPDRIHYQPEDGGIGATPRSWTMLAKFADNFDSISDDVIFQIIKGKVGDTLASQFYTHYKNYSKVIKMEDIEELVQKKAKTAKNPKTISKHVAALIKEQEPIQKKEMAEKFLAKYIDAPDEASALPMLAFFYALELEIWSSFIKEKKTEDITVAVRLAKLDAMNKKELFTQVTTAAATTV